MGEAEKIARLPYTEETALRELWRAHGGGFHGPHVEHATIEEAAFFRFLAAVVRRKEAETAEKCIDIAGGCVDTPHFRLIEAQIRAAFPHQKKT